MESYTEYFLSNINRLYMTKYSAEVFHKPVTKLTPEEMEELLEYIGAIQADSILQRRNT